MTRERAEDLLKIIEMKLRERRKEEETLKDEISILLAAQAYLRFLMHGLKKNPSLRKKENE